MIANSKSQESLKNSDKIFYDKIEDELIRAKKEEIKKALEEIQLNQLKGRNVESLIEEVNKKYFFSTNFKIENIKNKNLDDVDAVLQRQRNILNETKDQRILGKFTKMIIGAQNYNILSMAKRYERINGVGFWQNFILAGRSSNKNERNINF